MYGPGRIGYVGPRVGYGRRGVPVIGVGVMIFILAVAAFDYFPFILFLWWMIPVFVVPAVALSVRSVAGLFEERSRRPLDKRSREKELLQALARHGEISPARAALETSLSIAEADEMLSGLAREGHVEVHAREGRLGYALWEHDRKKLTA